MPLSSRYRYVLAVACISSLSIKVKPGEPFGLARQDNFEKAFSGANE